MPWAVFQHVDPARGPGWLRAGELVKVISAQRVADVLPALRAMEAAVETGLCAAGFVSYEAAAGLDDALVTRLPTALPLVWFGLYRSMMFQPGNDADDKGDGSLKKMTPVPFIPANSADPISGGGFSLGRWQASVEPTRYRRAIAAVQAYIAAGDTYQVNFTFRLHAPFSGDPWPWFTQLRSAQQARYAAYIDLGDQVICSVSPELFFSLDGSQITCRPMKGTSPRGYSSAQDRAAARRLPQSLKNRAENAMIVDMMRNDLGRIARPGTVRVASAFDVERYPTLWQMTSTVTAQTSASVVDILRALFPCASVTGAPKVRTMQIIAQLETQPRGLYTGAIGYVLPGRRAQFNVAIRTAVIDRPHGVVEYGVGGGILADSQAAGEYAECRTKARVLTAAPGAPEFDLLETMLWTGRRFFLLRRHLQRLLASADYFAWPVDGSAVARRIAEFARHLGPQRQRVRMLVSRLGNIHLETQPLGPAHPRRPWILRLAAEPVDRRDVFLYHKTTRRQVYDTARRLAGVSAVSALSGVSEASGNTGHSGVDSGDFGVSGGGGSGGGVSGGCDDVLLWNRQGQVTETAIANIVIAQGGLLLTPPVRCGLLPGTFRAALLTRHRITPRVITRADLAAAQKIWAINSVRGWIPVTAVLESSPGRDVGA